MTLAKINTALLADLRDLIKQSRGHAAAAVNSELVTLYWHLGQRIRADLLQDERADYGKRVIAEMAKALSAEYGRGFTRSNLHRMVQFAERFPDEQIVAALRQQLSWTHFRELIAIELKLGRFDARDKRSNGVESRHDSRGELPHGAATTRCFRA